MRAAFFGIAVPVVALSLAACSGASPVSQDGTAEEDLSASAERFYLSNGAGAAGGTTVKAVNESTTKCADGSRKVLCTVDGIDLSTLNLSDAQLGIANDAFSAGHALLKGRVTQSTTRGRHPVTTSSFMVSEVWIGLAGADLADFEGHFYNVSKVDVCSHVAGAPCPKATETLLNKTTVTNLSKVNLSALSDADAGTVQTVLDADDAVLVAGATHTVHGQLPSLGVTEAYTKLIADVQSGAPEGHTCGGIAAIQCAAGLECQMSGDSHPDEAGICTKPADDCRANGCASGQFCTMCWGSYACIPNGALC